MEEYPDFGDYRLNVEMVTDHRIISFEEDLRQMVEIRNKFLNRFVDTDDFAKNIEKRMKIIEERITFLEEKILSLKIYFVEYPEYQELVPGRP